MLLAGAALVALASPPALADVKIGIGAPLTGPAAAAGEQIRRGSDPAAKAINDAGGVNGEKIVLVYGDDASDPRQGVAVANQMVNDGVAAVMGHYNSSVAIPAAPVYAEEGIVQVAIATNPQLTEQGIETVFRISGRDDQEGEVAGRFIVDKYKDKPVGIIQDQTTYGKGIADAVKTTINAAGLQEKLYTAITPGERDYSAVVSRLKADNIAVVFFGGYHGDAGLLLRQMRDQGVQAQLITPDTVTTQEYWAITGPAGEGTLVLFGPEPRDIPAAKDAIAKIRADGYEPEGWTLYAYASLQVWAEGAKKAGSNEGAKVAAALHDGSAYQTVIGPISYDAKGDRTGDPYVLFQWRGGKLVQLSADEIAAFKP